MACIFQYGGLSYHMILMWFYTREARTHLGLSADGSDDDRQLSKTE